MPRDRYGEPVETDVKSTPEHAHFWIDRIRQQLTGEPPDLNPDTTPRPDSATAPCQPKPQPADKEQTACAPPGESNKT